MTQYQREIQEKFSWDTMTFDPSSCDKERDSDENTWTSSYYLGTCLDLAPSGKYWTSWSMGNVTEEEVDQDVLFYEALNIVASNNGGYITSGEGDPLDLFFCIDGEAYLFKDLSDRVKERVVSRYMENFEMDNYTLKRLESELRENGFYEPKISYTGFYSQGDGASFTFSSIDPLEIIKYSGLDTKYPKLVDLLENGQELEIYANAHREGRYYHEHSTVLNLDFNIYSEIEEENCRLRSIMESFEKDLKGWMVSKNQEIYSAIKMEYECQTSTEVIEEYYGDSKFDEKGNEIG